MLDLIVEQTFDVLAKFDEWGGDRNALLQSLRERTLIYFIDKHEFQLYSDTQDEALQQILPIAAELQSRGLLVTAESTGRFEITEMGRQDLGNVIAETESYIDLYDVFNDVVQIAVRGLRDVAARRLRPELLREGRLGNPDTRVVERLRECWSTAGGVAHWHPFA